MIFTDVVLPDGTTQYYWIDEGAEAAAVCGEILRECGGAGDPADTGDPAKVTEPGGPDAPCTLINARTGKPLLAAQSLSAQGIRSGTQLLLKEKSGSKNSKEQRRTEDVFTKCL